MIQQKATEMSDEALLKQAKFMNKTKLYDAFIMGLLIGIAIFSSVRNGFGLMTFLPLIYPPIAARNAIKRKELTALLNERGLEIPR